jgi:large conductance mechanosensitive channel
VRSGWAKEITESLLQGDLLTIAVGVVLGLAAFNLIKSLVANLATPIIAAVFAQPAIQFMYFEINYSQFRYGNVINAAIVFLVAAGLVLAVMYALSSGGGRVGMTAGLRTCPECTSWISEAAKRCPRCTATVTPATTNT